MNLNEISRKRCVINRNAAFFRRFIDISCKTIHSHVFLQKNAHFF